MRRPDNLVLFPLSQDGYAEWEDRSVEDIRAALRTKMHANPVAPSNSDSSTLVGKYPSMSKQSV